MTHFSHALGHHTLGGGARRGIFWGLAQKRARARAARPEMAAPGLDSDEGRIPHQGCAGASNSEPDEPISGTIFRRSRADAVGWRPESASRPKSVPETWNVVEIERSPIFWRKSGSEIPNPTQRAPHASPRRLAARFVQSRALGTGPSTCGYPSVLPRFPANHQRPRARPPESAHSGLTHGSFPGTVHGSTRHGSSIGRHSRRQCVSPPRLSTGLAERGTRRCGSNGVADVCARFVSDWGSEISGCHRTATGVGGQQDS